jgi:hypothetical protein
MIAVRAREPGQAIVRTGPVGAAPRTSRLRTSRLRTSSPVRYRLVWFGLIIAEQRMLSIGNRPLRIRLRYVADRPAPLDRARRSSGGR